MARLPPNRLSWPGAGLLVRVSGCPASDKSIGRVCMGRGSHGYLPEDSCGQDLLPETGLFSVILVYFRPKPYIVNSDVNIVLNPRLKAGFRNRHVTLRVSDHFETIVS